MDPIGGLGFAAVEGFLHPEFRELAAEGGGTVEFHDDLAAQRRQNLLIEGAGLRKSVGADRDMGNDRWVGHDGVLPPGLAGRLTPGCCHVAAAA